MTTHNFIAGSITIKRYQITNQRLIYTTLMGVYSPENNDKRVQQLREELIGKVKASMMNIFDDLVLNNVGDPLADGAFRFKKGSVESFHYKNISGGEKAAFDLILDLCIKLNFYQNTVFFIDEIESHMHTQLQGKLLQEIYTIIPEPCQLWIATHSLGVMRKAKELSKDNPNAVAFLDFSQHDFDNPSTICPTHIDGIIWEKFLSVAIGDFTFELAPEIIVICEGDIEGHRRKDFDAEIYRQKFQSKYPEVLFISGGSSNDIEKPDHLGYRVLSSTLRRTKIVRLVDRDDRSTQEVADLFSKKILVTSRRNLESYLFDDEVIKELVKNQNKESLYQDALAIKAQSIKASESRGNSKDDLKSASGEIFVGLKKLLQLTECGNVTEAFMRDTLAPLINEGMNIYKELENDIISKVLRG